MPQQHFQCPNCGTIDLITYRMADVGTEVWPPICSTPECFDVRMVVAPQPGDFGFDLKTDGEGGKGFQKFNVHRLVPTREGLRQVEEVIDSDRKMTRIEKDSEQRYRDGEGEPLRFRARHQSASNIGVNSFGESGRIGDRTYDSGAQPTRQSNVGVKRHGTEKPKIPLGPGMRRAGSALKG